MECSGEIQDALLKCAKSIADAAVALIGVEGE